MNSSNSLARFLLPVWLLLPGLWAGHPLVSAVTPRGGTRGTDVAVTFAGERLKDVEGLLCYDTGLALKSIDVREDNRAVVTLSIAPDAPLGPQLLRLRTKTGISPVRVFSVSAMPSVAEVEPNDDFTKAQRVNLGSTLEGVTRDEDADHYVFAARKGQWISAEVEAIRLGPPDGLLTDTYVAILNSNRFELASNDDNPLLRCDPAVTVEIPADGDYVLQVRDAAYEGNDNARYRIHLGAYRRPLTAFPPGGKAGETLKVRFFDGSGASFEQEITLPAQPTEAFPVYPAFGGATPPSPNNLRVSAGPNVLEVEPNDDLMKNATPGGAGICALNGMLEKPGDIDCFLLKLAKDQEVIITAYGYGIGSPVDPVLSLHKPDGAQIQANDDLESGRLDARITFKAPAEAEYRLRLQDKLLAGGPGYVYRVEVESPQPSFTFASPQFAGNDSQHRQWIPVPRGGRYATLLNLSRDRVGGDVQFQLAGLPPGVRLVETHWPERFGSIPVLFEAASNAPLGGSVAVFTATSGTNPPFVGRLRQTFNLCWDGNQRVFHSRATDRLPVAVCDEAPFALEIEKPATPLLREGDLPLKIKSRRKEGFTKAIQVQMEWRPNGVSGLGEATIPENQNECAFNLQANGAAELGTFKVVVLGSADSGYGTVWNASPYQDLTVAEPFVAGKIEMAAVERGKATRMLCPLQLLRPFEGKARAQLMGVPPGIAVGEAVFDTNVAQLEFAIETKPDSPLGKHGNLFVALEIPIGGAMEIQKTAYGTALRVDEPVKPVATPPQTAQATPPPTAPAPAPPPQGKPLTRLEQLRRQATGSAQSDRTSKEPAK
jgi:hypothetical protein